MIQIIACGLFSVIEELDVRNIIIGKQYSAYENYKSFIDLANSRKINVNIVKAGDRIKIDKSTYFDVLWPVENEMFNDDENGINNNSLVLKLCYNNFSAIFTGDIEKLAEEKIVEKYGNLLKCNILKVAHHGSKSSSIEEILRLYDPENAVIEVGEDNSYGHPNKDVLERFENLRNKYLQDRRRWRSFGYSWKKW